MWCSSAYKFAQKNWDTRHYTIDIIERTSRWLASISRLLKCIDNDETCDRKYGSGHPMSVRSTADMEQVEGMICGQDDMPNSHTRPREMCVCGLRQTHSACEALRNALYKCSTYLLTYMLFETLYNFSDNLWHCYAICGLDQVTSTLAIADRPRCRVGQFWPTVEDHILQTVYVYLQPL